MGTLYSILLLICRVYSRQYDIQLLENKPGLYFAKIFKFAFTPEDWTIAIVTDLNEIEHKLDQVTLIWVETSILGTQVITMI